MIHFGLKYFINLKFNLLNSKFGQRDGVDNVTI